jgi:hypothetical protein
MRKHHIRTYALIALCAALPGGAYAETWHVVGGPNGAEHSTWKFELRQDGGVDGHADVTSPDGNKTNLYMGGSPGQIRVVGMAPHSSFCQFEVREKSDEKASGIEYCLHDPDKIMPWSATIDAQQ